MDFFFQEETHTLASALRPVLEANHPEDFVACVHMHPLDTFLKVHAPDEAAVRAALLTVKEQIHTCRQSLQRN